MIGLEQYERLRLAGAGLVFLACVALPAEAWAAGDVGLYTAVQGRATYKSADSTGKASGASLEAMMKARKGDVVTVEKGATVRLVYFATGRQEAWEGPVSFAVGEAESKPAGEGKPSLLQLPKGAARRLGKWQGPVGGKLVRAGEQTAAKAPELASWEIEELAAARAEYEKMRKQAAKDDITPEFYLLTILADYNQRDEMAKVLAEARKRAPGHPALGKIETWLNPPSGEK